jgi:hypothetical protein
VQIVIVHQNQEAFAIHLTCAAMGIDNLKLVAMTYLPNGTNPIPMKPTELGHDLQSLLRKQKAANEAIPAIQRKAQADIDAINANAALSNKAKNDLTAARSAQREAAIAPYSKGLELIKPRIAQLQRLRSIAGPIAQTGVVHFRVSANIAGHDVLIAASNLPHAAKAASPATSAAPGP